MDADIIIVGAGLAGLMAARAACAQGAGVVLLTRKAVGMATNSAISNGVLAGPSASYPPETYVRDTCGIGKQLNNRPHVEAVARGIDAAVAFLRDAGCRIAESHGTFAVKPERPDLIPGVTLMKRVAASVEGSPRLTIRTGFRVTDILTEDDRVRGVAGRDRRGRPTVLPAAAVILASGGAAAIYRRNDNQKRALGQGYAMALKAGLELRDMEFVQFYPFLHAEPGIPSILLYPPVPKHARLIDAAGRDLAEKHGLGNLNDLILKKRDALAALLHAEMRSGPIYMDYRSVSSDRWERPPLAMLAKLKFDFRRRPFAVAPGAHFCMGGIRTDAETRTGLPGLFACGEVAWGLHGANRRGGNALAECMVLGHAAGSHAAAWALAHPLSGQARHSEQAPHHAFGATSSLAPLRQAAREIQAVAWKHAGLVRTEEGMRAGLLLLAGIEAKTKGIAPGSVDELNRQEDLQGACLVLRAVLTAGLARRESVGSFKRSDFAQEHEQSVFGNSCIRYDAASDRVSVTFTDAPSGP